MTGQLLSADLAKVLTARIDALPPAARNLLREVSVVGDVIPEAALEFLEPGATGALDELLSRRMLRRRTHGGYRFVTPLMAEAAYAALGKADLADRHARLARWAATTDALNPPQADEFTISHATKAVSLARDMRLPASSTAFSVIDAGVAAFGRSAHRAMESGEPDNALALLDRSAELQRLSYQDRLVRCRAMLRLGRSSDALGDLDDLAGVLGLSLPLDLSSDTPDQPIAPSAAAQTLMLAGRAFRALGEPDRAVGAWQRSWAVAHEANLPVEQADVLCRLGMIDYLSGRLRRAEEKFRTGLEVATGAENKRTQAWALQHLAWVSVSLGDFAGADDALGQAARLFAAQNDRMGRAWVRSSAAFTRLLAGRLREAQR
ncbi:MAG: adenylate/guanylate cyclase domain-containing protein, partial [Stackebrandtia sp.]